MNVRDYSDRELYKKAQDFALQTRFNVRQFSGLMIEIYRRRLYRRKGFTSIYEFAAKMASMNRETVDRVLRLASKFADKPKLLDLLENGKVGWSKLEVVATIARVETDAFWADKVENLCKRTLITYLQAIKKQKEEEALIRLKRGAKQSVVDVKSDNNCSFDQIFAGEITGSQYCLTNLSQNRQESENPVTPFLRQKWSTLSFPVSPQVETRLRIFKYKLEKQRKSALTFNEVLAELLGCGSYIDAPGSTWKTVTYEGITD